MDTIPTLPLPEHPARIRRERHTFALPPMCPVSGNPQVGSTITLSYRPRDRTLEVTRLYHDIQRLVGGLRDATGALVVRDMEHAMQHLTQVAADALGVSVVAVAELILEPAQRMQLIVRAWPAQATDAR